jgi:hypothetical protein
MTKTLYKMRTQVWIYQGGANRSSNAAAMVGAWHFLTLPKKESEEIKANFAKVKRGWGSLPVVVTIGQTTWRTSIFPDKRAGAYLLPLKAEVRKKERVVAGDTISFSLVIRP